MEIKLHTNIDSVARVAQSPVKSSRPIDSDSEMSVFEDSRALEAQLKRSPEIRPDVVERGKRLAGDPQYPPRETLQQLATLLALEVSGRTSES